MGPSPIARDNLLRIKHVGYCRSRMPPGTQVSVEDLVTFAKFFLCRELKRLWKDPVWDTYTNEEILTEFYSYEFATDETKCANHEAAINAGQTQYEEIYAWLDRKVAENQVEMKKQADDAVEHVSFSPEIGLDVEE